MNIGLRWDITEQTPSCNYAFNALALGNAAEGGRVEGVTDLDELHPLDSLGADGHHGKADGGANNAVSPRDWQLEEGGD